MCAHVDGQSFLYMYSLYSYMSDLYTYIYTDMYIYMCVMYPSSSGMLTIAVSQNGPPSF